VPFSCANVWSSPSAGPCAGTELLRFLNANDVGYIGDHTVARIDTATAAVAATRLEFSLAGATGYSPSSATNRRFREAAFLPILSPSEGQLRRELQQLDQRGATPTQSS
jgi:hypothetical protein